MEKNIDAFQVVVFVVEPIDEVSDLTIFEIIPRSLKISTHLNANNETLRFLIFLCLGFFRLQQLKKTFNNFTEYIQKTDAFIFPKRLKGRALCC